MADDNGLSAPKRSASSTAQNLFEDAKSFKFPKWLKWIAAGIGGVFVLLILLGLAVPLFVDFDALRAKMLAEVKRSTGFEVTVGPKIDLIFMPLPKATLYDLTVRHPDDDPASPLLKAKEVTIDIGLSALLGGRISIPKVAFDQAAVHLRQNGKANNWTPRPSAEPEDLVAKDSETIATPILPDSPADKADGAVSPEDPSPQSEKAPSFSLDKIALTNSVINYTSANGKPIDVAVDDGLIALSGLDGPFDIRLKGKAYEGRLPIDLTADLGEMKDDGKPVDVTLDFKTDQGKVNLDGEAVLGDAMQYKGNADIAFSDLGAVMRAMDPKSAALPVKKFELKGDVVASKTALRVEDGHIVFDEASGPIDLNLEGLGSDALKGDVSTKLNVANWALAKGFKQLDLQGQFSQSGGTTQISPLAMSLDGQSVAGAVALKENATAVKLSSPRLDLTPLLNAFGIKDFPDLVLNGMNIDAAMQGQKLTVNSLTVNDVRGMKWAASGGVSDLSKGTGAALKARLDSSNLLKSLRQIPDVKIPKEAEQFLDGPGSATADFKGTFDQGNLLANIVAMGGSLGVRTTITDLRGQPKPGALTFVLKHPNANALLGILSPGTKMGPGFNGPISAEAGIVKSGDTISVSNLKSSVAGTSVNGNVKIKTGDVPHVSGALTTGALDLEKWFGGKETKTSARENGRSPLMMLAATGGKWSTTPIDATWMNKLGLDLSLQASQLTSGPWTLTKPSMKVKLGGGTLDLSDVAGGFMGGSLKANAQVKNNGGTLNTKGNVNADSIQLGPLTQALVKTGRTVEGVGDLDLQVTSSGASSSALINGMNGSGTVKTRTLVVRDLNVQNLVKAFTDVEDKNWTSALLGGAQGFRNGTTAFEDATIPITIQNGIGTWPATTLKNPSAEIVTQGRLDLPAWNCNIENSVTVITHERRMERAIVFSTTGSLDNPQTKTNSAGIESKLQDRAGKLLKKHVPEKYKGMLNNLLGKEEEVAPIVAPTPTPSGSSTTTTPAPAAATQSTPTLQSAPVAEDPAPAATTQAAPEPAPAAAEPAPAAIAPGEPNPATPAPVTETAEETPATEIVPATE